METQTDNPQETVGRPRLERSTNNRMIAGVAAGLADYVNISIGWMRFGFVLATLLGGFGVPLYVAAWLLMPAANEAESIAARFVNGFETREKRIGAMMIAAAVFLVLFAGASPALVVLAGVIAVAYLVSAQ